MAVLAPQPARTRRIGTQKQHRRRFKGPYLQSLKQERARILVELRRIEATLRALGIHVVPGYCPGLGTGLGG